MLNKFGFATLVCTIATVTAAPCTVKAQRKAWHTYTSVEKANYINAELCLQSLPATLGLPGAVTIFDELQATHAIQAELVHGVGAFLPFHRLLMHAHQHLLQTECGYKGTQPYWDEVRDAGKFTNSVVFDPTTFGGNGVGTKKCIADGPFANYTLHLGPGHAITDHCLTRSISNKESEQSAQSNLDACYAINDWEKAWMCMEASPHRGGHGGTGGEMFNPISSPGDPLFYLHHSQLDRIWWKWQSVDPTNRLNAMGGTNVQKNGFPEIPGGGPFPGFSGDAPSGLGVEKRYELPHHGGLLKRDGDPGNVTTLGHVLNMMGVIPNATIADVMDIGGPLLCFEYI